MKDEEGLKHNQNLFIKTSTLFIYFYQRILKRLIYHTFKFNKTASLSILATKLNQITSPLISVVCRLS